MEFSTLWELCAVVDGATMPAEDFQSILAGDFPPLFYRDENGGLIGAGWAELQTGLNHQVRAFLSYLAHPDHRPDLERQIITALEGKVLPLLPNDDRPRILRLDFFDKHPDSVKIFEELGYRFSHAEDEMCLDLTRPLPEVVFPTGFRLENWTPDRAEAFYTVYHAAFSQRPNFPNWSQATWVTAFTGGAGFRADWSWLLIEQDQPVGYTVCHEYDGRVFITQIGISPSHQGRGLADRLIGHNLRQFAAAPYESAWLEVNVDNPRARRVYERIGFERVRRYTSYQKAVL